MEYEYSVKATSDLTEAIFKQAPDFLEDQEKLVKVKAEITTSRTEFFKEKRAEVVQELNESQKLQLDLAAEKGASSWLSSLPLKSYGFVLNKQELMDDVHYLYFNKRVPV